jgi:hypothetical protein
LCSVKKKGLKISGWSVISGPYIAYGLFQTKGEKCAKLVQIGAEMWICTRYKQTYKYTNKQTNKQTFIFIYKIMHLLKSSTCFKHYTAHPQQVYIIIVYMQPVASLLSARDCLVHWLGKNWSFVTIAQDSHLQIVIIPEASYIQLRYRAPEVELGTARNM